jgi:hypothetical protein
MLLFAIAYFFFWIGEAIMINSGAWVYYGEPNLLGIPLWIPISWGYISVIIRKLSLTLEKLEKTLIG